MEEDSTGWRLRDAFEGNGNRISADGGRSGMIFCTCNWPEPSGMCPSCNRMKKPVEREPEETEARSELRTVFRFAAEAHFEHQSNNEEKRYAK